MPCTLATVPAGTGISLTATFAVASSAVKAYHDLAGQYAIADRYFQPIAGQSSSNDMYLAVAKEVFIDNMYEPDATGKTCSFLSPMTYTKKDVPPDVLAKLEVISKMIADGKIQVPSTDDQMQTFQPPKV